MCAGQKSGSEAVIHAMSEIFHGEDTDAVLIDASNAFNSLNRMTALRDSKMGLLAQTTTFFTTFVACQCSR